VSSLLYSETCTIDTFNGFFFGSKAVQCVN
jgi:hypothetical protein